MKTLRASFLASLPRQRLNLNSVRNGFVSLASVPDEKDEFAELGPAVVKSCNVVPKLMTEKRDSISFGGKKRDSVNVDNLKRPATTRKSVLLQIRCSSRSDAKLDTSSKPLNFRQENVDSPKFNHELGSLLERLSSTTVAELPLCDRQNDSLLESVGFLNKPDTHQKKHDSIKKRRGTTRKSVLLKSGCSSRSDTKLDTSSKPLNYRQENVDSPKLNHGLGSLLERPSSTTVADLPPCDRQNDSLLDSIGFLKKAFQELSVESTHPDVKHENLNNPECDTECGELPEIITSSSVTVHNVPCAINLSQLKDAISVFGKISNAIVREVPKELDCCDIEFECAESRDRAVSAGRIMVENFSLLVRPANVPEISAKLESAASANFKLETEKAYNKILALKNKAVSSGQMIMENYTIGPETADFEIYTTCTSYADAAHAIFRVKHESETKSILQNCLRGTCTQKWISPLAHLVICQSTAG